MKYYFFEGVGIATGMSAGYLIASGFYMVASVFVVISFTAFIFKNYNQRK